MGHPRLERFQLVFFDLGLGLSGVLHKAKSLKTGDLVPNTPSFLAVSSQANHLNPLSPSFFFLPTYPSIHLLPSSITAGCGKEEKRKYKEGGTLKTANVQINSNRSDDDRWTRA